MKTYSLKVRKDGPANLPFSWEIFRADQKYPVEKSRKTYRTELLAKMAGNDILRQLECQQIDGTRKAKR